MLSPPIESLQLSNLAAIQRAQLLGGVGGYGAGGNLGVMEAMLARQQEQQRLSAALDQGSMSLAQGSPSPAAAGAPRSRATIARGSIRTENHNDNASSAGVGADAITGPMAAAAANKPGQRVSLLFMPCDDEDLSAYQCLVRKQIEAFEASDEDMGTNARGRNRAIVRGQVGIRCRHCKVAPPQHRQRAALYYPPKVCPGLCELFEFFCV